MTNPKYITTAQAAQRLTQRLGREVPVRTVREWVSRGYLTPERVTARVYVFDPVELDALVPPVQGRPRKETRGMAETYEVNPLVHGRYYVEARTLCGLDAARWSDTPQEPVLRCAGFQEFRDGKQLGRRCPDCVKALDAIARAEGGEGLKYFETTEGAFIGNATDAKAYLRANPEVAMVLRYWWSRNDLIEVQEYHREELLKSTRKKAEAGQTCQWAATHP